MLHHSILQLWLAHFINVHFSLFWHIYISRWVVDSFLIWLKLFCAIIQCSHHGFGDGAHAVSAIGYLNKRSGYQVWKFLLTLYYLHPYFYKVSLRENILSTSLCLSCFSNLNLLASLTSSYMHFGPLITHFFDFDSVLPFTKTPVWLRHQSHHQINPTPSSLSSSSWNFQVAEKLNNPRDWLCYKFMISDVSWTLRAVAALLLIPTWLVFPFHTAAILPASLDLPPPPT